jgi:hypothetical protein
VATVKILTLLYQQNNTEKDVSLQEQLLDLGGVG